MKPTLPGWIPRRDPLEDARQALAVKIDRHPRLSDPTWSLDESPTQNAIAKLAKDVGNRIGDLLAQAEAARVQRGVLITYRSGDDWVYADIELSEEVPAGKVESRGGEGWRL